MIKNLAKLKYWEIAALGLSLSVTASLLIMFATRALVGTWPQTNSAAWVAYLVVSAVASWTITGVAVEAILHKDRQYRYELLEEEILDTVSDFYSHFKDVGPRPEYHGSHVAGPMNLDELAEELGLAEKKKEADRA
jgi:hypothetical protein